MPVAKDYMYCFGLMLFIASIPFVKALLEEAVSRFKVK